MPTNRCRAVFQEPRGGGRAPGAAAAAAPRQPAPRLHQRDRPGKRGGHRGGLQRQRTFGARHWQVAEE
jgi:hypothetical protein